MRKQGARYKRDEQQQTNNNQNYEVPFAMWLPPNPGWCRKSKEGGTQAAFLVQRSMVNRTNFNTKQGQNQNTKEDTFHVSVTLSCMTTAAFVCDLLYSVDQATKESRLTSQEHKRRPPPPLVYAI